VPFLDPELLRPIRRYLRNGDSQNSKELRSGGSGRPSMDWICFPRRFFGGKKKLCLMRLVQRKNLCSLFY
jgi:hypothetical protein